MAVAVVAPAVVAVAISAPVPAADDVGDRTAAYRSPVDLALVDGERAIVTANSAAGTVSLVERSTGRRRAELAVGKKPAAVAAAGGTRAVVTVAEAGDLVRLETAHGKLVETGRVHLGFEPRGLAVSPDGRLAYVAVSLDRRLAVVDLETGKVVASLEVGSIPRHVALAADGRRLAVSCAGKAEIMIVDTKPLQVASRHRLPGFNPGQPAFSADGTTVFFPWTYDGGSHPSRGNIRRGWVTGSRLGRLRIAATDAGPDAELTGLSLDVLGRAAGDVAAVAVAGNGRLVVAAGGPSAGDGDPGWGGRIRDAATDPAVAGAVSALAVEPLPSAQPADAAYVASHVFRLLELSAQRRIADVKSRLQRADPTSPESVELLTELSRLEQGRRTLRDRIAGSP